MARERAYRDQLEMIREKFPDHDLLTVSEVAEFCGCCNRTVRRRFAHAEWTGNGPGKRITRTALARAMS